MHLKISSAKRQPFCTGGDELKDLSLILQDVFILSISWWLASHSVNTLRPRQDGHHFATFSSAFSWMKTFDFGLKFHWSLLLSTYLTIFQHWFRWWLGTVQGTSHYLNQWWLVYWRIYASLSLNELNWSPPGQNGDHFGRRQFQMHFLVWK